jgi:DNA-binding response OmpR family regulator
MKSARALPPLMMVDDDQNDAIIFARRLKEAGVQNPLLHFRNGGDAFMYLKKFCDGEKAADERPCLVFLDVNMPSLSGFDVLAWARQQSALRGMKIIMLSGATEPWDAQIAAKLGADDYLMKFPDAAKLGAVLQNHLTAAGTLRAGAER